MAHQVELADDIGGTLHIEPNDTPRAGEEVLAWIALTRKGGDTLSLNDCDCRINIYAQPRQANDTPVAAPPAIAVEGQAYPAVPGAEFTFPTVGAYELVIAGAPKAAAQVSFEPFELAFNVTVAAGESLPEVPVEADAALPDPVETDSAAAAVKQPGRAPRGIAVVVLATGLLAGLIGVIVRRK